jgi:hypothetical protein
MAGVLPGNVPVVLVDSKTSEFRFFLVRIIENIMKSNFSLENKVREKI